MKNISMLVVGGLSEEVDEHQGQIQPPAEDMQDSDYSVVVEKFKQS